MLWCRAWPGSDDGLAPSAVSARCTSEKPSSENLSRIHWAAAAHSSGGNWRGSATDRMATSSPSSVGLRHQAGNTLSQFHVLLAACYRAVLSFSTICWNLGSWSGQ